MIKQQPVANIDGNKVHPDLDGVIFRLYQANHLNKGEENEIFLNYVNNVNGREQSFKIINGKMLNITGYQFENPYFGKENGLELLKAVLTEDLKEAYDNFQRT